MARFNWSELFHFARAIEENGERFYRQASERVSDPELRVFFRRLATEEVGHGQLFESMQRRFGEASLDEDLPEEHLAYLRAYVQGMVFEESKLDEQIAAIETPLDAVRFAKRREGDAVHFYLEMRELLPEAERARIDPIIEEERRHFRELAEQEDTLTREG